MQDPENICVDQPHTDVAIQFARSVVHGSRIPRHLAMFSGPRAKLGPGDLSSTGAGLRADQVACRADFIDNDGHETARRLQSGL